MAEHATDGCGEVAPGRFLQPSSMMTTTMPAASGFPFGLRDFFAGSATRGFGAPYSRT
jgi:hypothetical protein